MGFSQMTPLTPALEASQMGSTWRWSGVATLTTSSSWASSISWWEAYCGTEPRSSFALSQSASSTSGFRSQTATRSNLSDLS